MTGQTTLEISCNLGEPSKVCFCKIADDEKMNYEA